MPEVNNGGEIIFPPQQEKEYEIFDVSSSSENEDSGIYNYLLWFLFIVLIILYFRV